MLSKDHVLVITHVLNLCCDSVIMGPIPMHVAQFLAGCILAVSVFFSYVSHSKSQSIDPYSTITITQFAYGKGLGSDALLCLSNALENELESEQEDRIVQFDFSATFDRVNHQGILYRLCSVGIGGSVLSILTQLLSNRYGGGWMICHFSNI